MIQLGKKQTLYMLRETSAGAFLGEYPDQPAVERRKRGDAHRQFSAGSAQRGKSAGNLLEETGRRQKSPERGKGPRQDPRQRNTPNAFLPSVGEEILLPGKQIPAGLSPGDPIEVFIYKDSEDRPIATTATPALSLGELALLPVVSVTSIGAFLDWGLPKDLFLPFKEQTYPVKTGDSVLVSLYLDKSDRLCATMHVYERLSNQSPYHTGDQVSGLVYEISRNFGAFVAVDDKYSALIPRQELFSPLSAGTRIHARVTRVLEDGRLDLSIREKSYLQLEEDAEKILSLLKQHGGILPYGDKSSPDEIKDTFSLSKNAFKRATGHLMKEGLIFVSDQEIALRARIE